MARPKYKAGYGDGSGMEYVTLNGKAVAKTNWGCGCCQSESGEKEFEMARKIANALNAPRRPRRQGRRNHDRLF